MKEPSIEDQILHELIDDPNIDLSCYTNGDLIEPEQAVRELAALIQSERRKAAIEALENVKTDIDSVDANHYIYAFLGVLDDRIAELESNTEKEK